MGTVISVIDSCGTLCNNVSMTPADYMDEMVTVETRIKIRQKKERMDVMGSAIDQALDDMRHFMGYNMSDNEEKAENDSDYKDMNTLKLKYLNRKRRDSDTSVNTAYKKH